MKKKRGRADILEAGLLVARRSNFLQRLGKVEVNSLFRHCSSYISNLNCAVGYLLEMEEKKYSVRNEEKAGFLCCKWLSMIWAKEI